MLSPFVPRRVYRHAHSADRLSRREKAQRITCLLGPTMDRECQARVAHRAGELHGAPFSTPLYRGARASALRRVVPVLCACMVLTQTGEHVLDLSYVD